MDTATKTRLAAYFDKKTEALRIHAGGGAALTEDDKKLVGIVSQFGCQSRNIAALTSILTDRPITVKNDNQNIPSELITTGLVVVPIKRGGGHNYGTGKPALLTRNSTNRMLTVMRTGEVRVGNGIYSHMDYIRPATTEEITALVDKLGDEITNHLALI